MDVQTLQLWGPDCLRVCLLYVSQEVHGVVDALFERLGCIGDYTVAERRLACAAASGGGSEGADPQIDVEKMRVFSLEETRGEFRGI